MGKSARVPVPLRRQLRLRPGVRLALRVLLAGLGAGLSACTIEHARGLGDPCLQDRECVEGLRCLPGTDNRTACATPPSGLPDVVVPPRDAAVSDAPSDAPGDVQGDLATGETGGDAGTPGDATPPPVDATDAAVDATTDARDASPADAPPADASVVDAMTGE